MTIRELCCLGILCDPYRSDSNPEEAGQAEGAWGLRTRVMATVHVLVAYGRFIYAKAPQIWVTGV